jgi:hypothetical protein
VLIDTELAAVQKPDHWPGPPVEEHHRADWEYHPLPGNTIPLVPLEHLLHIWENPRHSNPGIYQRRKSVFERLLNPFRPRGPSPYSPQTQRASWGLGRFLRKTLTMKFSEISTRIANVTTHDGAPNSEASQSLEVPQLRARDAADIEVASIPEYHSRSRFIFRNTPKKLNGELQPCYDDDADPPEGWGLRFEEGFSIPPILFVALLLYVCVGFGFGLGFLIKYWRKEAQAGFSAFSLSSYGVSVFTLAVTVMVKYSE